MITIRKGIHTWQGFQLAIDFTIPKSSFVAVLGPSGAGKSTLLNIIAGFETLSAGTMTLADQDHTGSHPSDRPISFVFQDNNSFAHMTVRENVGLGIAPSLKLSRQEWASVDIALDKVGILHLRNRKPGDMSGGERQRIALARVLIRQKPILFLDEAFSALGPALRREMLDLVKAMQQEQRLTVFMVTHQPDDAKRVADRVMFISNGRVHEPQDTDTFFSTKDQAVLDYLDGKD